MDSFDLIVFGHLSKDENIALGEVEHAVGGAVVYASIAARRIGARVLAVTKLHSDDEATLDVFTRHDVPVRRRPSTRTTSIRNTYHTTDRERRTCEALGQADPFTASDAPEDATAACWYLGGLMRGEFPEAFLRDMAARGPIAVDMQGFLRVNEGGAMVFRDWAEKRACIPLIHYLKVDAAEAETLTGYADREQAACTLCDWGANEVVLTHITEVLVCAGGAVHRAPFTARSLSGRTGRGDTSFAAYCFWRLTHDAETACRFAAALTSLKMETPGPFQGDLAVVEQAIRERY
ncbi:MAG TPA: PfkB family carbohydrate kinase [Candidatus Hydrogenedentes bacterium]|nr:PfkB family carbohydrate kinase [Candidatus Hydrogenedentota bacterium]